jgi:hypothetical protein
MQSQSTTGKFARRPFMEQRYGQRVPLGMNVRIATPSGLEWTGVLRNASISGGFIACVGAPAELANVTISGADPAQPGREFVVAGCVVRIDADGFAVEWQDMACPQLIALLRKATHGETPDTHDHGCG